MPCDGTARSPSFTARSASPGPCAPRRSSTRREEPREPAHRARHVHARQHLLASVALHVHQRRALPGPAASACASAVSSGSCGCVCHAFGTSCSSAFVSSASSATCTVRAVASVLAPPGKSTGSRAVSRPRPLQPPRPLRAELLRARQRLQPARPHLEGRGLRRQPHRRARREPCVGHRQVLQQDAPRHPSTTRWCTASISRAGCPAPSSSRPPG